jgi:glycosyltransferase involved in cell wall biosynthesis
MNLPLSVTPVAAQSEPVRSVPRPARPLKVLYFFGTGATGGAYRSLRFLLDAFPPGSVEPHVLCVEGPAVSAFRGSGVEVTTLPAVSSFINSAGAPLRGLRNLTLLRTLWHGRHAARVRAEIRRFEPDLVHVNEWFYLQAAAVADACDVPVVLHARTSQDPNVRWARWLAERFIDRHTDLLVSIDESVRHSLRGVRRSIVIYNPLPSPLPRVRREREPGRLRVTYLTGLMSAKGIDELFTAAKLLRGRKDIAFTVYGENPRPPEFYASFTGRASSLLGFTRDVAGELAHRVRLEGLTDTLRLGGAVSPEGSVFDTTDVIAFPSRMNGTGRSIFEAGVHGIPAVVALRDRIEDIVVDERTGLIVPERDPGALAAAFRRLADEPALLERLGRGARERYCEQFDGQRVAGQFLEAYRSVIARRGHGQRDDSPSSGE